MRWFKYMTDMRNDLFIKKLRMRYGLEGKAVWDLVLEIYAEACGNDPGEPVLIDIEVFRREIGISHKKMEKFLNFFQENSKLSWQILGEKIEINIPKMQELRDEWSRKLRSHSGPTPVTEDRRQKKNITPKPPKGGSELFEKFWAAYPKKVGKPAALAKWNSKKLDPRLEEIMAGLTSYKNTEQWKRDKGQYIPNPATFLNRENWLDEIANHQGQPSKPRHERILSANSVEYKLDGRKFQGGDLEYLPPEKLGLTDHFRVKATGELLESRFLHITGPP